MELSNVTDDEYAAEWAQASAERENDDTSAADVVVDDVETPAEIVVDPMAAVTAAIGDLAKAQKQTSDSLVSFGGQVADQIKQVRAEAEVAKSSTTTAGPTEAEIRAAEKDPEEWELLKAENPEWGTAIEKVVERRVKRAVDALVSNQLDHSQLVKEITANVEAGLQSRIAPVVQTTLVQTKQAEEKMSAAYQAVSAVHPEWDKTVKTPEFTAWMKERPPGIRALFNSHDTGDAIEMLNLYVQSKPTAKPTKSADQVAAERRNKLSASVIPSSAAPVNRASTQALSWEDEWAVQSKRREARAA